MSGINRNIRIPGGRAQDWEFETTPNGAMAGRRQQGQDRRGDEVWLESLERA